MYVKDGPEASALKERRKRDRRAAGLAKEFL